MAEASAVPEPRLSNIPTPDKPPNTGVYVLESDWKVFYVDVKNNVKVRFQSRQNYKKYSSYVFSKNNVKLHLKFYKLD